MGGSAAPSAARSSLPLAFPWGDALSSAEHEHPMPHSPRAETVALPGAGGTRSSGLTRRETKESGATFEPSLREASELSGQAPARQDASPGSRKFLAACLGCCSVSGTAKGWVLWPCGCFLVRVFIPNTSPSRTHRLPGAGTVGALRAARKISLQAPEPILSRV